MKIIRWPELCEKLGGKKSAPSKVTVWRWERAGIFPKRLAIGPGTTGWIESEIDEFLTARAAERSMSAKR